MISPSDLREVRLHLAEMGLDPATDDEPERSFFPTEAHRVVLEQRGLVVVGERGEGKSALFRLLGWLSDQGISDTSIWPPQLSSLQEAQRHWIQAYGEIQGSLEHPTIGVLADFASEVDAGQLRLFWWGAVVRHLAQALPDVSAPLLPLLRDESYRYDLGQWSELIVNERGALSAWLDQVEERLIAENRVVILTYDSLDRVPDPAARKKLVGALFAVWLSLQNRYKYISARIFVRPDVYEAARDASPDVSKLRARARFLNWDREGLFGLLARHMAATHPILRDLLVASDAQERVSAGAADQDDRERARMSVDFESHPVLGPLPLAQSNGGHSVRSLEQRVTFALAGPVVGEGMVKQEPALWIGSQLADSRGRIMPRSLLELVAEAARNAGMRSGGHAPLALDDLRVGLVAASKQRLREIKEDHPVVTRLEAIGAIDLPIASNELATALGRVTPGRPGRLDQFGADGVAVVDELLRLGVADRRADGRIDVPEIYRVGLRFRRRGVAY